MILFYTILAPACMALLAAIDLLRLHTCKGCMVMVPGEPPTCPNDHSIRKAGNEGILLGSTMAAISAVIVHLGANV